MHGLEAVAGVGQSAAHDHAHGVIEIGALHLVDDGNQLDVAGRLVPRRAAGALSFGSVKVGLSKIALPALREEKRPMTGRNAASRSSASAKRARRESK